METELAALRTCRLFSGLSDKLLQTAVLPRGTLRRFAKNAALIELGKPVDWFAVVTEGRVHILQVFSDGTSSLMSALRPGYVLGADLICTKSLRSPYYANGTPRSTLRRL